MLHKCIKCFVSCHFDLDVSSVSNAFPLFVSGQSTIVDAPPSAWMYQQEDPKSASLWSFCCLLYVLKIIVGGPARMLGNLEFHQDHSTIVVEQNTTRGKGIT